MSSQTAAVDFAAVHLAIWRDVCLFVFRDKQIFGRCIVMFLKVTNLFASFPC